MPHAVEDDDDALFRSVLSGLNTSGAGKSELEDALGDDYHTRQLGADEEKAADAQDFEDIGDDDLADLDDQDAVIATTEQGSDLRKVNNVDLFGDDGGEDGGDDEYDALFGGEDDRADSPHAVAVKQEPGEEDDLFGGGEALSPTTPATHTFQDIKNAAPEEEEEENADARLQRFLFEQSNRNVRRRQGIEIPDQDELEPPTTAAESREELFSLVYPSFEPGVPPRFGELLPQKKAYWQGKVPVKPPKPVQITKVGLDIEPDQEKNFRLPGTATLNLTARQAEAEAKGMILIANLAKEQADEAEENDFGTLEDDTDNSIGGVKWQDLVALCQDWDLPQDDASLDGMIDMEPERVEDGMDEMDMLFGDGAARDEWQIERAAKRQKVTHRSHAPLLPIQNVNAMVDNPEVAVSKLAKRLQLDLNDPYILIDVDKPGASNIKRKVGEGFKRDAIGGLTKDFVRRYNISNDEAYEALKANQTSKVRSNLQNVEIQHSLPAVKLQFPFYKTELGARDARAWHRPAMQPGIGIIHLKKNGYIKRKHLKGRDTQSIFERAADLSIADNSSIMLLEYSEEYPPMLSGFGMGNKLVNYYRRKDNEDTARPKRDIGETQVLMPEDKSPFSNFGDVDRGQTLPTLLNGMYRAPVFEHKPKSSDFVVARSYTHTDGPQYHLRNVENLHVVGQEFPLVEVPGTHSRKVTDAAKKRLRMLSYRMFRKFGKLKNEMILPHLPGTDVPQNRSKLREFLDYDKDKGWLPRRGEVLPEEPEIRSMIKPEDVSLLHAMQVGHRQLQDAGYNKDEDDMEAPEENEEDDDNNNIDKLLAPWQTTKNFIAATQGKAMLKLHGEGDPSGRGEAFSFIKTSMKGGFKEIGESIEDRLDNTKKKELGGHSYNVARQNKAYNDAIRRIWEAQQLSLASAVEHDDVDMGGVEDRPEQTPRKDRAVSAFGKSRADDETASMFSKASTSADSGKILRITREYTDAYGRVKKEEEVVKDARVIREYQRRRKQLQISAIGLDEMKRTGDATLDAAQAQAINAELARLERNKDRRLARERAKGIGVSSANVAGSPEPGTPMGDAGSPEADVATPVEGKETKKSKKAATGTTQRKCANCGQIGHIKTNKK